jgi:hypothetical protein
LVNGESSPGLESSLTDFTVVGDVTVEGDEVRVRNGNCPHLLLADLGIRGCGVGRIGESCVAVRHKAHASAATA